MGFTSSTKKKKEKKGEIVFFLSFLSYAVCLQGDINWNNSTFSETALGSLFHNKVPVLLTHCALPEQSPMIIFFLEEPVIIGELLQESQFMLELLIFSKFFLPTFWSKPHLLHWGQYFTSSEKFHSI